MNMKTVNVNCAGSYDILIEKGIFENAGNLIQDKFGGKRFCVITDENVAPLYLDSALKQLEEILGRFFSCLDNGVLLTHKADIHARVGAGEAENVLVKEGL